MQGDGLRCGGNLRNGGHREGDGTPAPWSRVVTLPSVLIPESGVSLGRAWWAGPEWGGQVCLSEAQPLSPKPQVMAVLLGKFTESDHRGTAKDSGPVSTSSPDGICF